MKNKKKILMPIMALVLSVILFGYQVPNIKAEEPEVIPNVYNPGSIITEIVFLDDNDSGDISLEDYTFITTNSANYFLNDILIELKDPIYTEDKTQKTYKYTLLFMDKEMTVSVVSNSNSSDPENIFYYIEVYYEIHIEYIKLQHAVLSEELPTTVEFTISPAGDMIDGEMPVTFQPVGEQPSIELIASNVGNITNGSLVIEDYQSSNNYTESFDATTIDPVYDFISFTGSDSAIGLKIGLDGNGFLYHYASISEGAYITLSFDIVLNNTTNYVDITYMLGDVVIETKKQKKDDIPNLPLTEPTKYGFIFKGWYLEPEFTTAITLETRFTTNTTVYGYFQEKTLISVKYYDGESIISQGMQYATESLLKPSNPVKPGHVFMGWYLDSEFTTKLENDATFESDVNIYAKFIAESGGAVIPTEENNKTLYLVGAAALLLILFIAISSTKGKPTKKKGK